MLSGDLNIYNTQPITRQKTSVSVHPAWDREDEEIELMETQGSDSTRAEQKIIEAV